MSPVHVLIALAKAGTTLAVTPAGKLVLGGRPPPQDVRAAVPGVGRALRWIASGYWRIDLDTWTEVDRCGWEERAAIMQYDGGLSRELAEQAAYLDVASQPVEVAEAS